MTGRNHRSNRLCGEEARANLEDHRREGTREGPNVSVYERWSSAGCLSEKAYLDERVAAAKNHVNTSRLKPRWPNPCDGIARKPENVVTHIPQKPVRIDLRLVLHP